VRADFPGHYGLIVAHVLFGSIAVLTAPFQLWPWLRRRYRALHRLLGRVYIFGGALPAATVALIITPGVGRPARRRRPGSGWCST
jgi:hypothetical protein